MQLHENVFLILYHQTLINTNPVFLLIFKFGPVKNLQHYLCQSGIINSSLFSNVFFHVQVMGYDHDWPIKNFVPFILSSFFYSVFLQMYVYMHLLLWKHITNLIV